MWPTNPIRHLSVPSGGNVWGVGVRGVKEEGGYTLGGILCSWLSCRG